MTTLFDGDVEAEYGFVDVVADGVPWPDTTDARGGQANGLCGAAVPGALALATATTHGVVPLRVELHDAAPPMDPAWEDVVEVSLVTPAVVLVLQSFQDTVVLPALPAAGAYRVRYSATGMDEAHDGHRARGGPVVDRYLLELWPAPPARDAVLRQTSRGAAYWHGVAASTPPPPSPQERAAVAAAAAEQERLQLQAAEERALARRWGGRPPTPRLLALGHAAQLTVRDRDLTDAVLDAPEAVQRELTVWAVGRAHDVADERAAALLAPAVAAIGRGDAVPAPFDDDTTAWRALFPGPSTVTLDVGAPADPAPRLDAGAAALSAVLAARATDPAAAAAGSVDAAASGPLGDTVLDEARDRLGLRPAGPRQRW